MKDRVSAELSFPGASVALTLKVWGPSGSGEPGMSGGLHGRYPWVKLHSKVEPGSLEAKWKVGVESPVSLP